MINMHVHVRHDGLLGLRLTDNGKYAGYKVVDTPRDAVSVYLLENADSITFEDNVVPYEKYWIEKRITDLKVMSSNQ